MAISYGKKAPEIVNLIIEIQRGSRNKYEMDKSTGLITLDRVNGTMLGYPTDYGYIPDTLCEDGDPLDGLLIIDESVPPGIVVPARPVGVLYMVDDGESDEKIILVPARDISKDYIKDLADLGENFQRVVEHFYSHYKDWKGGWGGARVSFNGWGGAAAAREVIQDSIGRAPQNKS
jgi:inorganic pyrophosphatase